MVKTFNGELGQATPGVRAFVEESPEWKEICRNKDYVGLNEHIRMNVCDFGANKHSNYSDIGIGIKLCS